MNLIFRIFIFIFLFGQIAKANMASPIWSGTMSGSAISSKDINILSEKIVVKIDESFRTAKFVVEYNIHSDFSGEQIPLLFFAKGYEGRFSVWMDDEIVDVYDITDKFVEDSGLAGFSELLEKGEHDITIYWTKGAGSFYNISEIKYFATDIERGNHKIRVEYIAGVWANVSGWIKEFSFRYSLSPAKYWKSFGSLEIIVEQEGAVKPILTNLGEPNEKEIKSKNTWFFNELPDEYIEISYIPTPNKLAKILISITPLGISIIVTILLCMIHFFATLRYRQKNRTKNYSLVVVIGSVFIPFLSLLSFVCSFNLIDYVIGEDAGRYHGYVFLIFIYYPVIMIIYWVIFWLIDRRYKKKLR